MIDVKWINWKRLYKLTDKVGDMDNQFCSYGYFKEQGKHPEAGGMTLAELMMMHEFREDEIPARPVFQTALSKYGNIFNESNMRSIKGYVESAALNKNPKINKLLTSIALNGISITKPVFGSFSDLPSNSLSVIKQKGRNAPMVEFGILKESIAYKTSLRKRYKLP